MTESKDRRQVALSDPDPSIALALKAREEFEREFLARRPTVEQLIERANQRHAEFIAGVALCGSAEIVIPCVGASDDFCPLRRMS
jgi:hypothetical protein